jgi:hypothetical protein
LDGQRWLSAGGRQPCAAARSGTASRIAAAADATGFMIFSSAGLLRPRLAGGMAQMGRSQFRIKPAHRRCLRHRKTLRASQAIGGSRRTTFRYAERHSILLLRRYGL